MNVLQMSRTYGTKEQTVRDAELRAALVALARVAGDSVIMLITWPKE